MRCKVEVSATGRSLVQGSSTVCGVSLFVIQKLQESGDSGPCWAVAPEKSLERRIILKVLAFCVCECVCLYIRLPALKRWAPTRRIFLNFIVEVFTKTFDRIQLRLILD